MTIEEARKIVETGLKVGDPVSIEAVRLIDQHARNERAAVRSFAIDIDVTSQRNTRTGEVRNKITRVK